MLFTITDKEYGLNNLSKQLLLEDDEYVRTTEGYVTFLEMCAPKEEDESLRDYSAVVMENFRDSEAFYQLEEDFEIPMQEQHILQTKEISLKHVKLVEEFCTNVVIVTHGKLDTYCIAMTGGGTSLAKSIELAYRIIDGESPFSSDSNVGVSTEGAEALTYYRDYVTPGNVYSIKGVVQLRRTLRAHKEDTLREIVAKADGVVHSFDERYEALLEPSEEVVLHTESFEITKHDMQDVTITDNMLQYGNLKMRLVALADGIH